MLVKALRVPVKAVRVLVTAIRVLVKAVGKTWRSAQMTTRRNPCTETSSIQTMLPKNELPYVTLRDST